LPQTKPPQSLMWDTAIAWSSSLSPSQSDVLDYSFAFKKIATECLLKKVQIFFHSLGNCLPNINTLLPVMCQNDMLLICYWNTRLFSCGSLHRLFHCQEYSSLALLITCPSRLTLKVTLFDLSRQVFPGQLP
jgi:hypothetical protein